VARSTAKIALTLLGSAALLGCCCVSCVDVRDEEQKDANGNVVRDNRGHAVHHRHYYYRPWWGWGHYGGYGPFWTSRRSYSPGHGSSVGRSSGFFGGGHSSSGSTSRGGFGSGSHSIGG
jgi:hypothetical protein